MVDLWRGDFERKYVSPNSSYFSMFWISKFQKIGWVDWIIAFCGSRMGGRGALKKEIFFSIFFVFLQISVSSISCRSKFQTIGWVDSLLRNQDGREGGFERKWPILVSECFA